VVKYGSRHNHLHSFFSYESISKYLFFLLEQQFTCGNHKEKSVVVIEFV
jgi:hypothetical protein